MPVVNDDFNRSCVRIDLDAERSGVFTPTGLIPRIHDADLDRFNACVARVAPGTPALRATQIAGAARRLARAVAGSESHFIRTRMRRVGEIRTMLKDAAWRIDAKLLGRLYDLLGYIDGPVALVPEAMPTIGGLDRALLVDLAMDGLRAELDEYADFCRYRAGEAARLGVPLSAIEVDRDHWTAERSEELRLERLVRRSCGTGYGSQEPGVDVFRVS